VESRRWCQKCRLNKCFHAGMKKELIQKGKRAISESPEDSGDVSSRNVLTVSPSPTTSQPAVLIKRARTSIKTSLIDPGPETASQILADLTGSVVDVCSPTPSADSFSSVESSTDPASTLGPGLEALSSFEREKILELVQANEVRRLILADRLNIQSID
jgi:hypothetical protein